MGTNEDGRGRLLDLLTHHELACIKARSGCDDAALRAYPDVGDAWRQRIERSAKEEGINLGGEPGRVIFPWGTWTPRGAQ
jgi:hypothetical protein